MNFSSSTVFVGDLSFFCTVDDLGKEFSPFGPIVNIRIKRDGNTNKTLSYGFVEFASRDAAEQAINILSGRLLCGRPMRVNWASCKPRLDNIVVDESVSEQESVSQAAESKQLLPHLIATKTSVHVSFATFMAGIVVTEEDIRRLFIPYGNVVDVTIKKAGLINNESIKGFGFVHFTDDLEGMQSAIAAVKALSYFVSGDVGYKCTYSRDLEEQIKQQEGGIGGPDTQKTVTADVTQTAARSSSPQPMNVQPSLSPVQKSNNRKASPVMMPVIRAHSSYHGQQYFNPQKPAQSAMSYSAYHPYLGVCNTAEQQPHYSEFDPYHHLSHQQQQHSQPHMHISPFVNMRTGISLPLLQFPVSPSQYQQQHAYIPQHQQWQQQQPHYHHSVTMMQPPFQHTQPPPSPPLPPFVMHCPTPQYANHMAAMTSPCHQQAPTTSHSTYNGSSAYYPIRNNPIRSSLMQLAANQHDDEKSRVSRVSSVAAVASQQESAHAQSTQSAHRPVVYMNRHYKRATENSIQQQSSVEIVEITTISSIADNNSDIVEDNS